MTFRRLFLPLTIAALAGLTLVAPRALAEEGDVDAATQALARLDDALGKSKSINETLTAGLEEVFEHYQKMTPPARPEPKPVPEGTSEEEAKSIEAENATALAEWRATADKFEKTAGTFKKNAEKAFIKALRLVQLPRNPQQKVNLREDVNIKAAEILGGTGNPALSEAIIKALDTGVFKAKDYDPTQLLYDTVFASLGKLNDHKALEWIQKEFIHANSSPRREVDKLTAAHKGMVLYTQVPGKLRYAIIEAMVTTYSGVEAQAEQSSTDVKIQAMKQFWDRIKADVIKACQYFAGEPTDSEGQVLARMDAFQDWFRDHDNLRKAPWVDEKPE